MMIRRAPDAPAEETQDNRELALNGPGGLGIRAKGYRLMDLGMIIMSLGFAWGAWELKAHAGDSERQTTAIVKSINDANTAMVQSLKESNSATVKALQEMTKEQKHGTAAMREIACLTDPTMRNRQDAREFCRRISRDEFR